MVVLAGEANTAIQEHPLQEHPRPSTPPHNPPASVSGRPSNPSPPSHHANGRHETDKLHINNQGYHVAHTVLLLLRMQQTYLAFRDAVPLLAAETARRAADLLKVGVAASVHRLLQCHKIQGSKKYGSIWRAQMLSLTHLSRLQ